jgi:hypothetical protein
MSVKPAAKFRAEDAIRTFRGRRIVAELSSITLTTNRKNWSAGSNSESWTNSHGTQFAVAGRRRSDCHRANFRYSFVSAIVLQSVDMLVKSGLK